MNLTPTQVTQIRHTLNNEYETTKPSYVPLFVGEVQTVSEDEELRVQENSVVKVDVQEFIEKYGL